MPLTYSEKCYDWMDPRLRVLLEVSLFVAHQHDPLSPRSSAFQREKTWAQIYQGFVRGL